MNKLVGIVALILIGLNLNANARNGDPFTAQCDEPCGPGSTSTWQAPFVLDVVIDACTLHVEFERMDCLDGSGNITKSTFRLRSITSACFDWPTSRVWKLRLLLSRDEKDGGGYFTSLFSGITTLSQIALITPTCMQTCKKTISAFTGGGSQKAETTQSWQAFEFLTHSCTDNCCIQTFEKRPDGCLTSVVSHFESDANTDCSTVSKPCPATYVLFESNGVSGCADVCIIP